MVSLQAFSLVVMHFSCIVTFLVIAALSKIFGAARRKRPLFPVFYASSLLLAAGMLLSLLGLDLPTAAVAAACCDIVALAMGAWVTWFYWEWLPRELAKVARSS